MSRHNRTEMDHARDELMSHIHRCGVMKAAQEQQEEWMADTVDYLSERYPGLSTDEVEELKAIGMRFCQPVIEYGATEAEMAGAA